MGSKIKRLAIIVIALAFIFFMAAAVMAQQQVAAPKSDTGPVVGLFLFVFIFIFLISYAVKKAHPKNSGKRYCKYCKAEADENDEFCPECGKKITGWKQKAGALDPEEQFRKAIKLDIWVLAIFWIIENIITAVVQKTALRITAYIILNTIITAVLFAALYGYGRLSVKIRLAMKREEGTFVGAIKGFFGIMLLIVTGIFLFCCMMGFMAYQPYLATLSQPVVCSTNECFASVADSCRAVDMTRNEDFGTINYAAKDCTFTKTIAGTNENPEMKKLLEGKSLSCTYEKGNFDRRLLASMIEGIDNCNGELKGIIGELLIFA